MTGFKRLLVVSIALSLGSCAHQGPDQASEHAALIESSRQTLSQPIIELSGARMDAVKVNLDRIIKEDPENYEAKALLAEYYLKLAYQSTNSDHTISIDPAMARNAASLIDEAQSLNPEYAYSYVLEGHFLHFTNRFVEAELAFQTAEELGALDPILYVWWGNLKRARRRSLDASEKYTQAELVLALGYGDNVWDRVAALEGKASVRALFGDNGIADAYYLEALELAPASPWLNGTYSAFLRSKLADIDGAVTYGEKALQLADYGVGRVILAFALYAKLGQILEENPDQKAIDYYFNYAFLLYRDLDSVMIFQASYDTSSALIPFLMKRGVSIETANEAGYTVLNYAAAEGQERAVLTALAHGADPNTTEAGGWTPFLNAVDAGNLNMVKAILNAGARVSDTSYESALNLTSSKNYPEIEGYIKQWRTELER